MGQLDLNAALVLVRVVQAGSFRAAGEALGMPKTTVSRKVSELEAQLGVQLLQRTTRKLSLTVVFGIPSASPAARKLPACTTRTSTRAALRSSCPIGGIVYPVFLGLS